MALSATTITPDSNHTGVERLRGFSFYEDAGATALVIIREAAVGGQILFTVPLTANAGATLVLPEGIDCEGGTYVQESSGSITGVLLGE